MIKYDTRMGAKHLNSRAREKREMMIISLRGMHCRSCPGINTIISFEQDSYNFIKPKIVSCCNRFGERIQKAYMRGKT